MKLLLVGGSPSTGKTAIIKNVITALIGSYSISYVKIDVVFASEGQIIKDEFGIETKTIYVGDLCPDHAEVLVLDDVLQWGEDNESDILIVESAGLCLRCSPFLNQGVNVVAISMLSGLHSVDKMKQLICFADIAMLTMNDLVSQAEREVFIQKMQDLHNGLTIIETNALQGTSTNRLCKRIMESVDLDRSTLELKGNPPIGTCTICVGKKKIGWKNHFGVIRKIDTNIADFIYRGD